MNQVFIDESNFLYDGAKKSTPQTRLMSLCFYLLLTNVWDISKKKISLFESNFLYDGAKNRAQT